MSFTFTVSAADWGRILPELILAAIALLVLLVDLLLPQPGKGQTSTGNFLVLPVLCLLGLAGAIVATIILFTLGDHQPAFMKRLNLVHQGESYALMLLATVGMMIMAAAISFLTVFLGLEMLSLALYILCGFVTRRGSSQESSMKYFLLSSFASAFLLYGIALIYGATGNTSFKGISSFLVQRVALTSRLPLLPFPSHTLLLIGMGLLVVGFAFKVSAVPFQAWTPDVYDGAPAPVTAFMSVGTKAAALIAFARVVDVVLP